MKPAGFKRYIRHLVNCNYSFYVFLFYRMSWQGAPDILIDRFDVRAHLDLIPEYKGSPEEELSYDERLINYERYRILVQNDFLGGINSFRFLQKELCY